MLSGHLGRQGQGALAKAAGSTLTAPENPLGAFAILMARLHTRPIKLQSLGVGPRHQDCSFFKLAKGSPRFRRSGAPEGVSPFFSPRLPLPSFFLPPHHSLFLPPSHCLPEQHIPWSMRRVYRQAIPTLTSGLAAANHACKLLHFFEVWLSRSHTAGKIKGLTPENPSED